jgi:hypothetical protein
LLDLAAIPHGDDVESAERYDVEAWPQVVDVAALESLLVLVGTAEVVECPSPPLLTNQGTFL